VQITTGVIHYGYRIVEDILEGLSDYMEAKGLVSLSEIVGAALPHVVPTDRFDLNRQGVASYDLARCVGCGQCYVVCQDAGGQCLGWDGENRRPVLDERKCLSCMVCSFVCPVSAPPLITYQEVVGKQPVLPPVSA
jgi:dihydropyrimidine dehydrogenase (NAD+) subunit PreA